MFDREKPILFKTRKQNALTRRLRRYVVCELQEIKEQNQFVEIPGLQHVMDPKKRTSIRIAFLIVIILCAMTTLFQAGLCVKHYIKEPVVTDVTLEESNLQNFAFSFCATETAELVEAISEVIVNNPCPNLLQIYMKELFSTGKVSTVEELWKLADTRKTFINLTVTSLNGDPSPMIMEKKIQMHPVGICLTFKALGKLEPGSITRVVTKHIHKKCPGSIYNCFQTDSTTLDLKFLLVAPSGRKVTIKLKYKKFVHLNKKNDPCNDGEAKDSCNEECYIKKAKTALTCKLPFMPYLPLPDCVLNKSTYHEYGTANKLLLYTSPENDCNCLKMCTKYAFFGNLDKESDDLEITDLNVEMSTVPASVIAERYAYDIISMLSDIGGNLGLFLGLSILGLFQTIQTFIYNKKSQPSLDYVRNPLARKVKKVFESEIDILSKQQRQFGTFNCCSVIRSLLSLKFISAILCWLLWSYCVYTRFSYFLRYPVTNVVELTSNKTLQFQTLIVCNINIQSTKIRKNYLKETNQRHKNRCNVTIDDVLDVYNASITWETFNCFSQRSTNKDTMFEEHFAFSQDWTLNYTNKTMMDGTCLMITTDPKTFVGTVGGILFIQEIFSACGYNEWQKVYTFPPEESSINSWDYITWKPTKSGLGVIVTEVFEIIRESTPIKPCISREEANQCKNACFENQLRKRLSCKLPFMPNNVEFEWCNSSATSKNAKKIYQNIEKEMPDLLSKECHCVSSCRTTVYFTISGVETGQLPGDQLSLVVSSFTNNQIQQVKQVRVYSLSKLLSEFGGTLGGLTGVCLLTFLTIIHSITAILCPKPFTPTIKPIIKPIISRKRF